MKHLSPHHTRPVTHKEEIELAIRIQAGDRRALDRLMLSHYRFVVSVSNNYKYQGVDLEDLVSEGCIGLHRAAVSFNPAKGYRFMSYAVWWIRQSIQKAIQEQSLPVRIPANYYVNSRAKLESKGGAEKAKAHKEAIRNVKASPSVEFLMDAGMDFHHPGPSTERMAEESVNQAIVETLLASLDETDAFVLRHRYGIGMGYESNLEAIGNAMGVSKERVRQRQKKAEAFLTRRISRKAIPQ